MSTGYQVVQEDIRAAAADLQDVADGVGGADPGAVVVDVASALPGSQSAAAARSLKDTWTTRFRTWSQDAGDRSSTLSTNADNYDAAEHAAAQRLAQIPSHLRPQ